MLPVVDQDRRIDRDTEASDGSQRTGGGGRLEFHLPVHRGAERGEDVFVRIADDIVGNLRDAAFVEHPLGPQVRRNGIIVEPRELGDNLQRHHDYIIGRTRLDAPDSRKSDAIAVHRSLPTSLRKRVLEMEVNWNRMEVSSCSWTILNSVIPVARVAWNRRDSRGMTGCWS